MFQQEFTNFIPNTMHEFIAFSVTFCEVPEIDAGKCISTQNVEAECRMPSVCADRTGNPTLAVVAAKVGNVCLPGWSPAAGVPN
jgi:hypothetical protein